MLAKELRGGEIVCLMGELGSGKTTFAQGVLEGLGAKGPYTSPTFLVMKHYKKIISNFKAQIFPPKRDPAVAVTNKAQSPKSKIQNIYHIDAYRVGAKDILNLGWEEIVADKKNVIVIEWAERIKNIVPKRAVWISFRHKGRNEREITLI